MHEYGGRVDYPVRRTRPKGDPDPGWVRCTWDEALDLIAAKMLQVRASSGAHAVAFSKGTPGATGMREYEAAWLSRLANHFGTPNMVTTTHLCQWPRDTGAAWYTYGLYSHPHADVANSACVLLWGTNPSATGLGLAQQVVAAKQRGAKLIVVDPRRVGLASKADLHVRVRPGSDGALALSVIDVLIQEQRYDDAFVREWTNAPLLVRTDIPIPRLLRVEDVAPEELGDDAPVRAGAYLALGPGETLVIYDPSTGSYRAAVSDLALNGARAVKLRAGGTARCQTVFNLLAASARRYAPDLASAVTRVPTETIIAMARMLANERPVSHFFWNGIVQHTNGTQTSRAIAVLYTLLGDLDVSGGNVMGGARVPVNDVMAREVLPKASAALRLGRDERPLGPPGRPGAIAAYDLYDAILDGRPYPVRAVVTFGNNMLLANGDTLRGRKALERLEFYAVIELFHTPTSQLADVVLPAASFMEAEALLVGYDGRVRRRPKVVEPLHERRSDVEIIFALAPRLGLGDQFWQGDITAGYDYVLAPAGLTWADAAGDPVGVQVAKGPPRQRTYAETDQRTGLLRGFGTPTRKVEIFSETFAAGGTSGLPIFEEPLVSPVRTPSIARHYPLVLTTAKRAQYLHSQHRGLPRLRKSAPNPTAQLHPATAERSGISDGDWIYVETPKGRARFAADITDAIMEDVVCVEHGWWEACEALGLPAMDPYSETGSNPNLLVLNDLKDPIGGATPFRSTLCRVVKAPSSPTM